MGSYHNSCDENDSEIIMKKLKLFKMMYFLNHECNKAVRFKFDERVQH